MTIDSPPESAAVDASGGSRIEILTSDAGRVVVRRLVPDEVRQRATRVVFAVLGALLILPAIVWCLAWWYTGGRSETAWIAAAVAGLFVGTIAQTAGMQFLAAMRSWTLTADGAGLTVDVVGPFRRATHTLRRDQIADVRLGFDRQPSAHSPVRAWMEIHRTGRGRLYCLANSPGDELAAAADALRAALGFPKRDWP